MDDDVLFDEEKEDKGDGEFELDDEQADADLFATKLCCWIVVLFVVIVLLELVLFELLLKRYGSDDEIIFY